MADEEIVSASAVLAPDDPDGARGEVDHVAGAGIGPSAFTIEERGGRHIANGQTRTAVRGTIGV